MLRILQLNNEAVHYLQQAPSSPSDAIAKWEEALRCMQSEVNQHDNDNRQGLVPHGDPGTNPELDDNNASSSGRFSHLGAVHSVALDRDFLSGYSEPVVSSHHDWSVYGRALLLSPQHLSREQEQEQAPQEQDDDYQQDQQQPQTSSNNDQFRATGVIMYNLGLTYHFLGLQDPQNHRRSRCWLEKALRIYSMVPNIAPSHDDGYNLLSLAVHNNMGSIHSQFFHRHEVSRCRNILQSLLSRSSLDHLSQVEYMFFVLNALFMDASDFNQAPAA